MDFDWGNFVSTLVGAFAGALGAYWFNIKQEEKQQKENEKSQLVQLFYDLNILSKYLCIYGSNVIQLITNIYNGATPYNTPLYMEPETINIDKLGFITLKSNKMYEILAHTRMNIASIYEQGIIYNEKVINKKKDTITQLVSICFLFPKLMAMIYVCFFNINSILIKYYKSDNLIKDNILNSMSEILEILDNYKKEHNEISNNKDNICMYTGKPYTQEQINQEKENIDYIDYILNDWILDFGLSKKSIKNIVNNIKNKLHGNEVKNDL